MSAAQREFDIVLYGATGFVGKLTAEYLARAGGDARIALAGRPTERVLALRETLAESAREWPILTVEAGTPSPLAPMAPPPQAVATTPRPTPPYAPPLL